MAFASLEIDGLGGFPLFGRKLSPVAFFTWKSFCGAKKYTKKLFFLYDLRKSRSI